MKPAVRENAGQLGLAEYYCIEGLNAYGTTVFFLGIFFHARFLHGFSDTSNLLLAATQGGTYVLATRAGGRFADRVGPNLSVVLGLAGMCFALVFGWQSTQGWALFAAVAIYSASTALTWPALEAAIARAPGRIPLARRAGLYNVTWAFVGSAGFFAGGTLFAFDPDAVFWAPLAAHALEIAWFAMRSGALREKILPHGDLNGEGVAQKQALCGSDTRTAKGWREVGAPGGAQLLASTDGGAQRQDPAASTGISVHQDSFLTPGAQARFLRSAWIANGLVVNRSRSIAPTVARIPWVRPAPSNAGPAAVAQPRSW